MLAGALIAFWLGLRSEPVVVDQTALVALAVGLGTWQVGMVDWIVNEALPHAAAEDLRKPLVAGTAVPEAFLAFGLGRGHLALATSETSRHREHLDRALAAFSRAVAQDSSFACAWAGLGWTVRNLLIC